MNPFSMGFLISLRSSSFTIFRLQVFVVGKVAPLVQILHVSTFSEIALTYWDYVQLAQKKESFYILASFTYELFL